MERDSQVGGDQYVPVLVPAVPDEEDAHGLCPHAPVQADIQAFVLTAAVLALLPHTLVSEYADETKLHVVQQPASVHGGACQHPVVTVLAIVKQFIEVLLVYGMNTLAVEPEQAQ